MTSMAKSTGKAGDIPALRPGGTTQTVAVGATTAAMSNAVAAGTSVVRVVSTEDAYFAIGSAPTATTSSAILPADAVEYFRVIGGSDKIAFLQVGTSGTARVTECDSDF